MRRLLAPLALALLVSIAVACDDDDATAPTIETPTAAAGTASPAATPDDFDPATLITVAPAPDPVVGVAVLIAVRIGGHPGFDRIVFQFEGARPAAEVGYVDGAVGCGSGEPVAVAGGAVLQVRLTPAVAHDEAGNLTIAATEVDGTGGTILAAVESCDFEADVTWAVGVADLRPFEVTTLDNPTRLVIDVRH
jgi:hypothetical protein